MLRNSVYILSKLILKLSKYLKLRFPLKLFALYKTFMAQNGKFEWFGVFCVDSYYMYFYNDESKVESSFSTAPAPAKQIFTQKFELPSLQIKHHINWKVDASSCGIQSKIHLKSNC